MKHALKATVAACMLMAAGFSMTSVQAANLSYPNDCKSQKLRKAASKNGCSVVSGSDHLKVFKDGKMITTIPHSVKQNNTCRSIIRILNKEC